MKEYMDCAYHRGFHRGVTDVLTVGVGEQLRDDWEERILGMDVEGHDLWKRCTGQEGHGHGHGHGDVRSAVHWWCRGYRKAMSAALYSTPV